MTIKVRCEVPVVEIDGTIVDANKTPKAAIIVESDWRNRNTMSPLICLTIDGKKYTVNARDIETAVKNAATNS